MAGARRVRVRAAPSLALVKYWGKADARRNLAATSSLAVTVTGLYTETRLQEAESDHLTVDDAVVPAARHAPFFSAARAALGVTTRYRAAARNNFPGAAGLASSASLFAALAAGCAALAGAPRAPARLSALARVGSASAARAVWGGFSALPAGAETAFCAFPPDHWPELRLLVAVTSRRRKPISSRAAMLRVAETSPYYGAWVAGAEPTFQAALAAVRARDLRQLGPHLARQLPAHVRHHVRRRPTDQLPAPAIAASTGSIGNVARRRHRRLGDHGRRPAGQDRLSGG